jgi:hypothetical protein
MNNNKLLISILLALVTCAGGATAFSTPLRHERSDYTGRGQTQPSATPWQVPRGGDLATPSSSTSLKSSLIGAIDVFYKIMPLTSAFITCGIKASAADLVAQKRAAMKDIAQEVEGSLTATDEAILGEIKTPLEKRRNFAFFMYGGCIRAWLRRLSLMKSFRRYLAREQMSLL